MRLSLRLRVLVPIVAVNAGVLGIGALLLARPLSADAERRARERSEQLVFTLGSTARGGVLNVASILQWPTWNQFADAVILDEHYRRTPDGRVQPEGRCLNPLGSARRGALFDEGAVLRAIAEAVERGVPSEAVQGGRVVPIRSGGRVLGGCWYRLERSDYAADLLRLFLVAFVISTVLLTGGAFFVLQRFVLLPVDSLARASRRIARGEPGARVGVPGRDDELAELMQTFNDMAARVQGYQEQLQHEVERATDKALRAEAAAMTQRRLAAMGELAAGIAHEINNPLGGLQNAVESLRGGRLPPERQARYLELLQSGLERIQLTVGQLLRFTPRHTRPAPVQLRDPLMDAVALVRHRAKRAGVELQVGAGQAGLDEREVERRHRALPPIEGEAHELAQAVLNLLVNALDALEERGGGGRVLADLRREGEEQVLSVEDDGPGVDAETLARVADLFYTTKAPGKGTGLGLALVHNVVAAHGGRVHLESEPGRGFRAALVFPPWARRLSEDAGGDGP